MVWNFIGFFGGALIALALIPQLVKTWKTKSARDISLIWTVVLLTGLIFYFIYAIKNYVLPLIVFAFLESILTIVLILMKIKFDGHKGVTSFSKKRK